MSKLAQIASSLGLTCLVTVSFARYVAGRRPRHHFLSRRRLTARPCCRTGSSGAASRQ
jgi:hypothetical protein